MIKTIQIREGVDITLTNDSLWMEEYRDQFGQDILPTLMPLLLGMTQTIGALAEEAGEVNNIDQTALLKVIGSESLLDIGLKLGAFEIADIHKIMWAMAKAYDENIKDLKTWLKELAGPDHESLPLLDVIAPALLELAVKGVMSPKNWERLKTDAKKVKDSLQPKTKKMKKK